MAAAASQFRAATLSFSGAGHLLTYHLGVASVASRHLLPHRGEDAARGVDDGDAAKSGEAPAAPPTRPLPRRVLAVSGSSSGAIAATLFACLPHRTEEYVDRFLADGGGRALFHLEDMMREERESPTRGASTAAVALDDPRPSLHIATTRCSDGALRLFDFSPVAALLSSAEETDRALACVRASCKIPAHFHPADVLAPSMWSERFSGPLRYPESEGVEIDGISFIDGGIAAPAPPTPEDGGDGVERIVVSPISGIPVTGELRVSPSDESQWLWPFDVKCRGNFRVNPSMQNVRAMQMASGAGATGDLRGWYEKGVEDGEQMLLS